MKNHMVVKCVAALAFAVVVSGCADKQKDPPQTQLQMREFQTRSFQTENKNEVMTAVMEALQDEGFMVKNAVPELGLIAATREADVEDTGEAIFMTLLAGQHADWNKNAILEATANVKSSGKTTKVRLTFQEKTLTKKGGTGNVKFIDNPSFYQKMFDKVQKSLFIENQKI